jgi:hypothetical protein
MDNFLFDFSGILQTSLYTKRLQNSGELQTDKRKQQPARDLPMAFSGIGLMIDQKSGCEVNEPMKAFPISPAQKTDRQLVTGERKRD